jgi:predicted extracellular nuclease
VFFSEYVEGSSSYKALELTAREDSTLAGCRLVTYFNGASAGTGIALDGSVPAGSTYVLCSSGLGSLLETACTRTTNLTFNGDDAVALECNGTTIDVIGQIGVDPGDAWTGGEASTLNQTLRRLCTASLGDTDGLDAFDPTAEWTAHAIDTFDGLGSQECPLTPGGG